MVGPIALAPVASGHAPTPRDVSGHQAAGAAGIPAVGGRPEDATVTVDLPDPEACFDRFRAARFGDGVTCVYCESDEVTTVGTTEKGARTYDCPRCDRQFNDFTRTVFEDRQFAIEEMFYIVKEMDERSIAQIQRDLGRHQYEPVLRFVHHVRAVHPEHSVIPLREVCSDPDLYS